LHSSALHTLLACHSLSPFPSASADLPFLRSLLASPPASPILLAPCTPAASPSDTPLSHSLVSLLRPPSPHIQPASFLSPPPSPPPPPPSLLRTPAPPSLSLLSLSGIPSPLPDGPSFLRTLSALPIHTSQDLPSGTTSLLHLHRTRPAQTSL